MTEQEIILAIEELAGMQHRADREQAQGKTLTAYITMADMITKYEVVKAAIHGLYQELDALRECVKLYRGA